MASIAGIVFVTAAFTLIGLIINLFVGVMRKKDVKIQTLSKGL